MAEKFLTQADKSGWLLVRRVSDNEKISLPRYLKVDYTATKADPRLGTSKRDFFKALEGSYKGTEFSVALKSDGSSYLTTSGKHLGAAKIKFNRATEELWYGESGPVKTVTDPDNPIPVGTFDLEIPDSPHAGGNYYTSRSSYATVWFRIRPGGANTSVDRYLHPGSISAGCVTATDVESWTAIYGYLIDRRKNDVSVGTITVVE